MKRRLSVLVVVLIAFCSSLSAAPAQCGCAAYAVHLYAFDSPFDAGQELERASLELGPANVASTVIAQQEESLPRYLVFKRACDAYSCYVPRPSVVNLPSRLYEWAVFQRSEDAFAEYAQHENAARGVITMGDGSIVVYWSSTGAAQR